VYVLNDSGAVKLGGTALVDQDLYLNGSGVTPAVVTIARPGETIAAVPDASGELAPAVPELAALQPVTARLAAYEPTGTGEASPTKYVE
jgi:hypothetical protein